MRAYVAAIAGVVLLAALVTMIAPSGKTGKFVKGTARLLILAVMLSPVASWLGGEPWSLPAAESVEPDAAYLARCADLLARDDEALIASYLESEWGEEGEVFVERSETAPFPRRKIVIKLAFPGISGEDERINKMTRIREAVAARYGCETEVS